MTNTDNTPTETLETATPDEMSENLRAALLEVRARIAQGWTQGAFARDALCNVKRPCTRGITAWSLHGAVLEIRDDDMADAVDDILTRAVERHGFCITVNGHALANFNNAAGRTVSEVFALIDEAINSVQLTEGR